MVYINCTYLSILCYCFSPIKFLISKTHEQIVRLKKWKWGLIFSYLVDEKKKSFEFCYTVGSEKSQKY